MIDNFPRYADIVACVLVCMLISPILIVALPLWLLGFVMAKIARVFGIDL
jgi:hypothetical protein